MPARLDHVTIVASDLDATIAFYEAALAPLGLVRLHELGDEEEDGAPAEVAAFGADGETAVLWVAPGDTATRHVHLAWRVPGRAEVDAFFAAATGAGGTVRDAPRRWTVYRRGEYNAIVADPDGNLVEAVGAE